MLRFGFDSNGDLLTTANHELRRRMKNFFFLLSIVPAARDAFAQCYRLIEILVYFFSRTPNLSVTRNVSKDPSHVHIDVWCCIISARRMDSVSCPRYIRAKHINGYSAMRRYMCVVIVPTNLFSTTLANKRLQCASIIQTRSADWKECFIYEMMCR